MKLLCVRKGKRGKAKSRMGINSAKIKNRAAAVSRATKKLRMQLINRIKSREEKKFVSWFLFWVDELTHDQSCIVMMGLLLGRSGRGIFTGIETRAMRHTNTDRWNWSLIVGDVIWCCNYDLFYWWANKNRFPKIKIEKKTIREKSRIKHCLWSHRLFKYCSVSFASSRCLSLRVVLTFDRLFVWASIKRDRKSVIALSPLLRQLFAN